MLHSIGIMSKNNGTGKQLDAVLYFQSVNCPSLSIIKRFLILDSCVLMNKMYHHLTLSWPMTILITQLSGVG